jgi:hypothetical protein
LTSTADCAVVLGELIAPAKTHLLGVGHAIAESFNPLGALINGLQWSPPSAVPIIEFGPEVPSSPRA